MSATGSLGVLYRGPLASCNHGCAYCPFAKQRDSAADLAADRRALDRFVAWATATDDLALSILFTPWGEALTRRWYRDAMVALSHLDHVRLVAAQTNLSRSVDWVADADPGSLELWCTYHPTEERLDRFVARTAALDALGVRHSVGIVGFPEHLAAARALRHAVAAATYLWVNPAEGLDRPYTDDEVAAWSEVDPLFPLALRPMASRGRACRTGEEVVSVDGVGLVRRCHFVPEVIGRIDDGSWRTGLRPRSCPQETCDCFIGYVHRDADLYDRHFGAGVLSRVPRSTPVTLGQRASASASGIDAPGRQAGKANVNILSGSMRA